MEIYKSVSIPVKQPKLFQILLSFPCDRGALLPKWTALGVKTKFDATCKMVRSDWPRILGGSPGQSAGREKCSPFMQSGGGSPRRGSPFVQSGSSATEGFGLGLMV